jgi:hypothetical protein
VSKHSTLHPYDVRNGRKSTEVPKFLRRRENPEQTERLLVMT